jgi:MFS family permease
VSEIETKAQDRLPDEPVPFRHEYAIYGIGLFATTTHFMLMPIVPLFAAQHLGLEAGLLAGIALGCRPALSLFFSIHAGILMDRIGTNKVLLAMGVAALLTPFMYPALPFIWAFIIIQLISGMTDSIGWMGAQTLIGQVLKGRTRYAGRLGAVIRIGHIVGPPLVGHTWDLAGPWAAFSLVGLCGVGYLVCTLMLPPIPNSRERTAKERGTSVAAITMRDLTPRLGDYMASFRLLSIPAVAITVLIGMMVHVGNNINSTFFVYWMGEVEGISATLIGYLVALSSATAAAGSLWASSLRRRFKAYWVLWTSVFIALIVICMTPLISSAPVKSLIGGGLGWIIEISPLIAAYIGFCIMSCIRTLSNGVHQPLVINLMLATATPEAKGQAIGLRGTANRVTSVLGPVMLGWLAGVIGLEAGFYVMGLISAVFMLWIAWLMIKHPEIHPENRS